MWSKMIDIAIMNKYKLRHKILEIINENMVDDPIDYDKAWHSPAKLAELTEVDLELVKAQCDYMKKAGELESDGEVGDKIKYIAILDGYLAFWDEKYIDMMNDRRRVKWGARAAIASTILIIVINIILLLNYFAPKEVAPLPPKAIKTTNKCR
jgi:hypothetical protein